MGVRAGHGRRDRHPAGRGVVGRARRGAGPERGRQDPPEHPRDAAAAVRRPSPAPGGGHRLLRVEAPVGQRVPRVPPEGRVHAVRGHRRRAGRHRAAVDAGREDLRGGRHRRGRAGRRLRPADVGRHQHGADQRAAQAGRGHRRARALPGVHVPRPRPGEPQAAGSGPPARHHDVVPAGRLRLLPAVRGAAVDAVAGPRRRHHDHRRHRRRRGRRALDDGRRRPHRPDRRPLRPGLPRRPRPLHRRHGAAPAPRVPGFPHGPTRPIASAWSRAPASRAS